MTSTYFQDYLNSYKDLLPKYVADFPQLLKYFDLSNNSISIKTIALQPYDRNKYIAMVSNMYSNVNFNDGITSLINDITTMINDMTRTLSGSVEKDLNSIIFLLKAVQMKQVFEKTSEEISRAEMIEIMKSYKDYGIPIDITEDTIAFQYDKYPEYRMALKEYDDAFWNVNKKVKDQINDLKLAKFYNTLFTYFVLIFVILFIFSIIGIVIIENTENNIQSINMYYAGIMLFFVILIAINYYISSQRIEPFTGLTQDNQFSNFFNGMIQQSLANISNLQSRDMKNYMSRTMQKELRRQNASVMFEEKSFVMNTTQSTLFDLSSLLYTNAISGLCIFIIVYLLIRLLSKNLGIDWSFDMMRNTYLVLFVLIIAYIITQYERSKRLNFKHKLW